MQFCSMSNKVRKALVAACYALATVLFIWCAERLLPKMDTGWMEAPKQVLLEEFRFTDLYLYFHRKAEIPTYEGRQVVLLDIHAYRSREEIAQLLDSIAAAEPYLVGLDVIFGERALSDPEADRHLTEAVRKSPKVIVASEQQAYEGGYRYVRSFFSEEIGAEEGLVNFPQGILRELSPTQVFDGDCFPSFAYRMISEMGISVPDEKTSWLIDYSIVDTTVLRPYIKPFNWSFLHDQIVVIGDALDMTDLKKTPFAYRVNTRMFGVQIHKQIIQTAMSGRWFKQMHAFWTWLIMGIFLWLWILAEPIGAAIAGIWQPRGKEAEELKKKWISTVQKTCRFVLIVLLIMIGYILFWAFERYFEILKVMIIAPATLWIGRWLIGVTVHGIQKIRKK